MEVVSMMKGKMKFEETELRLGLPGNKINSKLQAKNVNGKRGFADDHMDLNLNLLSSKLVDIAHQIIDHPNDLLDASKDSLLKPPAKAQVVGWPPVRSYRKNIICQQKKKNDNEEEESSEKVISFVKVSLDGAPYLRKVDLKMYSSYQQLSDALGTMFSSFTIGKCGREGMMDFMNESKLMDVLNSSDYVPTYQDKDGDWMLVGDVPWEMFVGSCKRLRIMKGAEAVGLAPRAMEKCKNRS